MRWSVWILARGALPAVAVANLIPMALFYTCLDLGTVQWAISIGVVYAYSVAAYQLIRRRRVSGMVLVTLFMSTVRCAAAASTGHPKLYFAIPVFETVGFALMFLVTLFVGREPLVVRLARDLVPGAADSLAARRSVVRSLSLVWTLTYLGSSATTGFLLYATPLRVFVATHTFAGWTWTLSGVTVSVLICKYRARGVLAAALRRSAPAPSLPAALPAGPAVPVLAVA